MGKKVSLIIPTYNRKSFLENLFSCVINQDYRPLELIIVDDGSTDGSYDYIKNNEKNFTSNNIEVKILHQNHQGQAQAVNLALKYITGEYLVWFDSDDIPTFNNISKKVEFLENNPDIGIVQNNYQDSYDNNNNNILTKIPEKNKDESYPRYIFDDIFYSKILCYSGCFMIRTKILFDCYKDKEIPISPEGQNFQLLLPVASKSKCGYIPDILYTYYHNPQSHSNKKRAFTEVKSRIENFSKLRLKILPYCNVDQDHYIKETLKIEKREKYILYTQMAEKARNQEN